MEQVSYAQAGVNVEQGDVFASRIKQLARRPGHQQLVPAAGGYAAVYPVTEEQCIAVTTDGVGTKVLLAEQFQAHHAIGVDLVAMCANDLICVGARPTLFLDYFATGKLSLEQGIQLIEGVLEGCDQSGMLLVGGETAEMPDVYDAHQYDVAGFAVGEVAKNRVLTGEAVAPGQVLIGLPASGIHSNGLSLARKCFTDRADLQLLLEPTQIYVKPVLAVLAQYAESVTGLVHITGGGVRNVFRLNHNVGFVIDKPLPVLPVFERLSQCGVPMAELYQTFNMGMGMALMVQAEQASAVVACLQAHGCDAAIVGAVTEEAGTVLYQTPQGMIPFTHQRKDNV